MAVLPDLDALALWAVVMFEKTKPVSVSDRAFATRFQPEEMARLRRPASVAPGERSESRGSRRKGDALRAVEWGEITARLNAARDLRLLLRNESQAPIEAIAASFGDAAARYFQLIDDNESGVNLDALGQSKVLDVTTDDSDAIRQGGATGKTADAAQGDAREMQ